MTVYKDFKKHFATENLTRIFDERVIHSRATGIDNLSQLAFRTQSEQQIGIISRKVIAGNYTFTKYKLKLISKGRKKFPREISIPTVRDRIAIRVLCEFLKERFASSLNNKLPQKIISQVKKDVESKKYSGCIKLDVSDFYPSIIHNELESRLKKRIRDGRILNLIRSSLNTPTVSVSKYFDAPVHIGVPQGLSISNVLAEIYLINIDKFLRAKPNISYYRYVDDVLVFCDIEDADAIAKEIIHRFRKIGLTIHDPEVSPDKSNISPIDETIDYLGYRFNRGSISARPGTIEKLRSSIVAIFTSFKHANSGSVDFLLWRLNLRITGCVFENKSKGWLFFFSEINDESLLHSLDHFIKKMVMRFDVSIRPKKFSRAFKELSHRKYETRYIPNFDKYDIEQKKLVLSEYFGFSVRYMKDEDIEFQFHKRIGKQVRELQEDIADFNY